MKAMARQRSHSIEFNRQVAQEFIAGESLYALSKRHDISRQLIRVWVQKYCSQDPCDKRLSNGPFGIDNHSNARDSRLQLTQEPKLLCPNFRRDEADPGGVATGPVEAGDEAISDWVAPGRKHDRHRRRCGLGRERGSGIANDKGYL